MIRLSDIGYFETKIRKLMAEKSRASQVEALDLCQELTKRHPKAGRAWKSASQFYLQLGRSELAVSCALKSTQLKYNDPWFSLNYAQTLLTVGDKQKALEVAGIAAAHATEDPALYDNLGTMYSLCDEIETAREYAEKAVTLDPSNARYNSNLAAIYRMLGNIDLAEKHCDTSLALDPSDCTVYFTRSDLRRWSIDNNHVDEMESLLERGVKGWRNQSILSYALSKELEDIGDYSRSFSYLKSASDLRRSHTRYSLRGDIAAIQKIIRCFTEQSIASLDNGYGSSEPIFVVGLPRTGTTLVDRILSSHPDVFSAGELNCFATELVKLVRGMTNGKPLSKSETIEASLNVTPSELGQGYIRATRPRTGHTPRFTDKLPLNYLYLGLISAALPNAKIVLLNRNPMAACYAIYRMAFTGIYPFSYDLEELANYYVAFTQLVEHWKSTIPLNVFEVNYEDLVTDTRRTVERLLLYCELDWYERCLSPEDNKTASSTASAVQVRRPIYSSSLEKWKNYKEQLSPLVEVLRANGIDTN